MIIEQPSALVRWLLCPKALWRKSPQWHVVYLTFDDGPVPEVTPWVLDELARQDVKATFFMVGENARKHPELFERIKEEGHCIGNHTYNHLNGLKYGTDRYVDNVDEAEEIFRNRLFRPPYGFITRRQFNEINGLYDVVMWDVVTRDYSRHVTAEQVLENVKRYTRNGSIITFHDSLKSYEKLKYALPRAIEWLKSEKYMFCTLRNK